MEHADYMQAMNALVKSKAFWAREATIAAMMDALSEERELYNELEYYERKAREMVPLEGDKPCQK